MKKVLSALVIISLMCFSGFLNASRHEQEKKKELYVKYRVADMISILDKHVACLSDAQHGDITLLDVHFKDPRIVSCATAIEQGDNLKPLKRLWAEMRGEEVTEQFVSEFCLLLFVSYQSVIGQAESVPKVRVSWFAIVSLYAQLSAIPLHKLFDALHECWMHYQKLTESYQDDEQEEPTWSWIQEYWWVPSTCIVFIVVSFARWYKAKKTQVIEVSVS